jgi:hypothetical protein
MTLEEFDQYKGKTFKHPYQIQDFFIPVYIYHYSLYNIQEISGTHESILPDGTRTLYIETMCMATFEKMIENETLKNLAPNPSTHIIRPKFTCGKWPENGQEAFVEQQMGLLPDFGDTSMEEKKCCDKQDIIKSALDGKPWCCNCGWKE